MKLNQKQINMDYRNSTAATSGMMAETHWPRDDQTMEPYLMRVKRESLVASWKRDYQGNDDVRDRSDFNTWHQEESRRCQ